MRDPTADLSDIRAPILNISGRDDPIVTPACSQAMTRFVSGATAQDQIWGGVIADWLIARD